MCPDKFPFGGDHDMVCAGDLTSTTTTTTTTTTTSTTTTTTSTTTTTTSTTTTSTTTTTTSTTTTTTDPPTTGTTTTTEKPFDPSTDCPAKGSMVSWKGSKNSKVIFNSWSGALVRTNVFNTSPGLDLTADSYTGLMVLSFEHKNFKN